MRTDEEGVAHGIIVQGMPDSNRPLDNQMLQQHQMHQMQHSMHVQQVELAYPVIPAAQAPNQNPYQQAY